jgi:hypothetical protein
MCRKEPEQPGSFRQPWKQSPQITMSPAVKRTFRSAPDGEQNSEGDDLAGVQQGLRMLALANHCSVYPAEQFDDKIFSAEQIPLIFHGLPPCWCLKHLQLAQAVGRLATSTIDWKTVPATFKRQRTTIS